MDSFTDLLPRLNEKLRDCLVAAHVEPVLNGNLCYEHLEAEFWRKPPNPNLERKRALLRQAARSAGSGTALEIGVNGGHSLLLMLCANPQLRFVAIDSCRQLDAGWGHVEVYVEEAIRFLRERFPGRIEFRKGDSLRVLYDIESPLRLVHFDGTKANYEIELRIVQHLIRPGGILVLDDVNVGVVRRLYARLLDCEKFQTILETPRDDRYQNVALRLTGQLAPSWLRHWGRPAARAAQAVRIVAQSPKRVRRNLKKMIRSGRRLFGRPTHH